MRGTCAPFGVGASAGQRRSEQPHAGGEPGARGVRRPATLGWRRLQAHLGHLAAAARHRSLHGRTDEIIQWAACKWGIADNVLRAITVRESTWYQHEIYRSGRCVTEWGCGDVVDDTTAATRRYCTAISRRGHDYQADYAPGICPKTFSIAGVMSWQDPAWGRMEANQNGTFPFNRDSTAFALDYLGSYLRGCYEGWEPWLSHAGPVPYEAGDLWGCVGSWYAGEWRTRRALDYVHRVREELRDRPWLEADWKDVRPPCSAQFGCAVGVPRSLPSLDSGIHLAGG